MTDTPDVTGMSDTSLLDFFIAVDNSDESLLQPMLAAVSAELRRRNLLDDHGVNEAWSDPLRTMEARNRSSNRL